MAGCCSCRACALDQKVNCPICGAESRVLDTRAGAFFTIRRRRECDEYKHRFTTVEIHLNALSPSHLKRTARGITDRIATIARDLDIAARLHENGGRRNLVGKAYKLDASSLYRAARRGRQLLRAKL